MSQRLWEYLLYDSDGVIVAYRVKRGDPPDMNLYPAGLSYMETVNPAQYLGSHYIDNGIIQVKNTISPQISGTTVSNLPIPCTVTTDGATFEVTDGTAELSYPYPGDYAVKIEAMHYNPTTIMVTAT